MSNWERRAEVAIKWFVIPAMLFGIGFMVIGPRLGGAKSDAEQRPSDSAKVNQQPIEPGRREWMPVSPPQVNVSVTRKIVEEDPIPPIEGEPPPVEIPDDTTGDPAGIGGMTPPTTGGDQSGGTQTGGAETKPASEARTNGAFRGIGGRRF